jgi:hypothetical protein
MSHQVKSNHTTAQNCPACQETMSAALKPQIFRNRHALQCALAHQDRPVLDTTALYQSNGCINTQTANTKALSIQKERLKQTSCLNACHLNMNQVGHALRALNLMRSTFGSTKYCARSAPLRPYCGHPPACARSAQTPQIHGPKIRLSQHIGQSLCACDFNYETRAGLTHKSTVGPRASDR